MKNQIYRVIAIFGVFLGLTIANVQGQTPSIVQVEIPFEFSVGKATLKPGVYTVNPMSGSLLTLRSVDGKSAVILNAPISLSSSDEKAGERLVFNKSGERYFLSQIWLTADTGRQLWTERKPEKPERVEISLRVK
jgi:hypothetical protein